MTLETLMLVGGVSVGIGLCGWLWWREAGLGSFAEAFWMVREHLLASRPPRPRKPRLRPLSPRDLQALERSRQARPRGKP